MRMMQVLVVFAAGLASIALLAQSDADFQGYMKTVAGSNGKFQKGIAAKDKAVVDAEGAVLETTFKQVEAFWQKRNVTDAANLSKQAHMAAAAATKAADAVSEDLSDAAIKKSKKKTADSVIHYLTAALMGGAYGLVGGRFPRLFMADGLLFGGLIWVIADELAVPALRLGPPPEKVGFKDHALGLSSHLVFGVVLDLARRKTNEVISPR